VPHHWWLIDPDNPGPRQRAKAVKEAARGCGAEVLFVGRTKNGTWYALVDASDEDEDAVYEAIGGRGKLWKLEGFEPDEPSRKREH
jgi:hypothetical protein